MLIFSCVATSFPLQKGSIAMFLRAALIFVVVSQIAGWTEPLLAATDKPNIVFIFADDLGWTDLGCYGSGFYKTPHIDRLSEQGLKFTCAYTNAPNCAPTRACLMSGRYSPRHGIYTVSTGARGDEKFRKMIPVKNITDLPLSEVTMADAMKQAGYVTGMFGKWHLGKGPKHHPSQRGFDEAISASRGHFGFKTTPHVPVDEDEYLADFLTDQAVSFIERHQDEPFFLYLPHNAVHTPIHAKETSTAKFQGKAPVGGHHNPVYAGMIDSVDEGVGRIMAKLDELKLADNTIVIFYSDNGGLGGYGELGGSTGRNITNNAPLRGGKGMLYEGGVRVPLIIRWPKTIPAGTVCDEPVISIDFYPTFLEVAAAQPNTTHELDGISFLPLLKSGGKAKLDRDALYWHFPGYLQADVKAGTWRTTPAGAIRVGDYKLLEFFEDDHVELYNLRNDLSQKQDLAAKMPDKANALRDQLHQWRKSVNAPMPTRK
ncbi:sulfatase [Symmachiella dynata]|uniref:sulfatase n=1 Tax=Symmachiella dynata TaxID=2527995 RepID=UPI0018D4C18D|nr:sulfatase [Symmachiella dynata]